MGWNNRRKILARVVMPSLSLQFLRQSLAQQLSRSGIIVPLNSGLL
ncbi:MAG: hypothetical protein ACJAUG_003139 [Halioglobus sp.]|jgi:hypothetical protein